MKLGYVCVGGGEGGIEVDFEMLVVCVNVCVCRGWVGPV